MDNLRKLMVTNKGKTADSVYDNMISYINSAA